MIFLFYRVGWEDLYYSRMVSAHLNLSSIFLSQKLTFGCYSLHWQYFLILVQNVKYLQFGVISWLLFLLCAPRCPEERQLRPPGTPEERGGGREREDAEPRVLRPAAAAHQLAGRRDCSRGSAVTTSLFLDPHEPSCLKLYQRQRWRTLNSMLIFMQRSRTHSQSLSSYML